MKALIFLTFVTLGLAGRICLPKGWVLQWTFPKDDKVSFKLTLDDATTANFGWAGIGFKYFGESSPAMKGADIANFIFDDKMTDRYAVTNGLPELDIELGGEDDLINTVAELEDDHYVFRWTRKVDSQDKFDKVYTVGNDYTLLWACGDVVDGIQMKHFTTNRSTAIITLSDDFDKDCEDTEESDGDSDDEFDEELEDEEFEDDEELISLL